MHKVLTLLIPISVITALLLFGCKGKSTDKNEEKVKGSAIEVALVEQRDITESVAISGSLQAVNEVNVGTRGPGKIIMLAGNGKTGTRVKKGQVVARLDNKDAKIQLRSAKAALNAAVARLEQAKAGALQQSSATDAGIANADASLAAAKARYQQAQTSKTALESTTRAQIRVAEQILSAAQSRYDSLKKGSRDQERQIAQNNVNQAKSRLDLDQANHDRYQELYNKGAISRSQYDMYATTLQLSKVQYDSALQQLNLIQQGARQEDLDAAMAQVKQAQAGLDAANAGMDQVKVAADNVEIALTGIEQAKAALQSAKSAVNINLMRDKDVSAADASVQQFKESVAAAAEAIANTEIVSPVNGVISQSLAEVGQTIGGNAPVLRLTTDKILMFEAKVSELQATKLKTGQQVNLQVDALDSNRNSKTASANTAIRGRVEMVVPVVNEQTRSFTVRVIVDANSKLFPGMFARGVINVATHKLVTTVPRQAVIDREGKQLLFIVQGTKVRETTITTSAQNDKYVQVISGVMVGEKVVVAGQQSLIDGDTVSITK